MKSIVFATMIVSHSILMAQTKKDLFITAVQIRITDMQLGIDFYSKKLGLKIVDRKNPTDIYLKVEGSELNIVLHRVENLHSIDFPKESQPVLAFECEDLTATVARLKLLGIEFLGERRKIGNVGWAISFRDPFGIVHSLVEQHNSTKVKSNSGDLSIHNIGYYIPDASLAEDFYSTKLGFDIVKRESLPTILRDGEGKIDLMMHERPVTVNPAEYPDDTQVVFVLATQDLSKTVKDLKKQKIKFLIEKIEIRNGVPYIAIQDCFKNAVEIIEK